MADTQMEEFHGRLRRVAQNRSRGAGFATADTAGGSPRRARRPRRSLLRPALLVLAVFMALKAALLAEIGPADYQGRVERLRDGTAVAAAGAWALQVDPATRWLAGQLHALFAPLQ
ncbi:hypothetical protein [Actibacterium sp. MT2.3-13A]|uniref:hypothetical protein n=1 Tax=Actibacterium sp. MT2.3-13A TaxID=2828332 RepID=UPI001BA5CB7E|nr:hypothetical protein [Actibacterium sp. MT2.3-13A]